MKKYKLRPDEIRPLVPGCGGCIASDLVTVEGLRVGVLYRLVPKDRQDSGWTFLSGTESDEYLETVENLDVYDVNTLANLDPSIIAFLHHPPGSAFARDASGVFQPIAGAPVPEGFEPKASAPFYYGEEPITDTWALDLPVAFKSRMQEDDLVFYRPGMTVYVAAFGNDRSQSIATRLADIENDVSPGAFELKREEGAGLTRFSYRLEEPSDDQRVPALYGFIMGPHGHLQLAIYFDHEDSAEIAYAILHGAQQRT